MADDIRILAVDDDELTLVVLKKTLEAEHFLADTANSAQEAFAMLRDNRYDAILCDMWMPGMNGKAFYEYLEREFPGAQKKVVFMTADIAGEATWSFIDGQNLPYVMKPFNRGILLQKITTVAGRSPVAPQAEPASVTPPVAPAPERPVWDGRERRGRRRIATNSKVKVESANSAETSIGTMIDASLKGAAFVSERKYPVGTQLQISFPYPNVSSLPQSGTVVNAEQIKGGFWRISLEFTKRS